MPDVQRTFYFSLRTLLSLSAGMAFVGLVVHWFISMGSGEFHVARHILLIAPWAIGSFAGIWAASRRSMSTLFGAIVGGVIGTFVFPGLLVIYLYFMGLNGVNSLWVVPQQLAMAFCGSGLLAAFVGIPREGIGIRANRRNRG